MKKISLKGMLPLLILSEAKKGASGKEIALKAAKLTDGNWKPSPGSVYPLLRSMESKGWIEAKLSEKKGRREIGYRTTRKGIKSLDEGRKRLVDEMERMVQTVAPLVMSVVHEYDDEEIDEFKRQNSRMQELKLKIMGLPAEKSHDVSACES